jgi:dolichol-phosphate mannosyltransferase
MENPRPLVSIVCPAYQEEEVLPIFHRCLSEALLPLSELYAFEILYIDDGSTDGTLLVLRRLAELDPRVGYLSLSRNFGHQAALTAGLEHARGDAVVTLDSDLQHPPSLIPALIERWREGHDVVLTRRQDPPEHGWFKRTTSAAFYRLLAAMSQTPVSPAASDFRLLSRRAVEALTRLRECHRFLRSMVNWLGFRVTSIDYQAAARAAGRSRYTLRRMLRLAEDGLLSFSRAPLRLPLFAGLGLLGLGALDLCLLALGMLLPLDVGPRLWHALIGCSLLLNGLTLTSLGVMGEYLGRVYEQVKQRPIYVLKESSEVSASAGRTTPGAVSPHERWPRPGTTAA